MVTYQSTKQPEFSVTCYPVTEYDDSAGFFLHETGNQDTEYSPYDLYNEVGADSDTVEELQGLGNYYTYENI